MTLKEAIEKAGEGGKIRRTCWPKTERFKVSPVDCGAFTVEHVTATDWEVVEDKPIIEVGDVVTAVCDAEQCRIIGIHPDGDRCAVQNIKQPWCVCDDYDNERPMSIKTDISLIHKGPIHHVYPSVKVYMNEEVPFINLDAASFKALSQNKRYTLKLTEE